MEQPDPAVPDKTKPAPTGDPIEIVGPDKLGAAPGEPSAVPPSAPILGKFKSLEDVVPAYANLEQETGRRRNELGTLRQTVEQYRQQGEPRHAAPPPAISPDTVNEQFREQLERDPFGTMMQFAQMVSRQELAQYQAQQRAQTAKLMQFAQNPEYADVAVEAMQAASFAEPIPAEEAAFIRAKMKRLEGMVKAGATATKTVDPPHIEGAGASRSTGGLRVELDEKGAAMRNAVGEDRFKRLAEMVAKKKANGGDTREWSIDDWKEMNRA